MIVYNYYAVFAIVNAGFADIVMDAARSAGARGGTVIQARGTISKEAEKEIVLILVKSEVKEQVLHAIYREVGFDSSGQGITFALPVADVVGIVETNKLV